MARGYESMIKSLQGHFLVASPHLPDPNFCRTVVLMVQHHAQGALGVILNRPSDSTVQEVIGKVSEVACFVDDAVGIGGPIEGPLMAVHRLAECGESEILPGVHFSTQREHILRIVQEKISSFRLVSGYAGWAGGQLESELEVGGWLITPANVEHIFHTTTDELWKNVAQDIGTEILNKSFKIKHVPEDPSLN